MKLQRHKQLLITPRHTLCAGRRTLTLLISGLLLVALIPVTSATPEIITAIATATQSAGEASELAATSLSQLQKQGRLKISTRLIPSEQGVRFQAIELEITVATMRWFARGSRVMPFEIPGAVVYNTSNQAVNFSINEGGVTWAKQLWTQRIYPQREGQLILPAIDVFVSINAEHDQIIEGTISLPSQSMTIASPAAMVGISNWLASESLTMEQTLAGEKAVYQPGDAITRTITLTVNDVPAMMLPALTATAIEGLALYSRPPQISDNNVRGTLTGQRRQQFIYTVEAPGQYTLPAYTLHWWNISRQQHETLTIDAIDLATQGYLNPALTPTQKPAPPELRWQTLAMVLALLLALLAVMRWALPRCNVFFQRLGQNLGQRRNLQRDFLQAISQADNHLAVHCLYQVAAPLASSAPTLSHCYQHAPHCQGLLKQLMRNAYSDQPPQALTSAQARQLLHSLHRPRTLRWPWQRPVELSLNH